MRREGEAGEVPRGKKSRRLFSQNFRCRQFNCVELFYLIDIISLCHILQGSILPGQCFTYPPCSGSVEGPRGMHLPQLADWCLRSAGFINDVCRGYSLPYSLYLSLLPACNSQLSVFAVLCPMPSRLSPICRGQLPKGSTFNEWSTVKKGYRLMPTGGRYQTTEEILYSDILTLRSSDFLLYFKQRDNRF
jgi:hypothetical protein